jgi:hypothetical protein
MLKLLQYMNFWGVDKLFFIDTPAEVIDTPAEVIDTPAEVIDTPAEVIDTPARCLLYFGHRDSRVTRVSIGSIKFPYFLPQSLVLVLLQNLKIL